MKLWWSMLFSMIWECSQGHLQQENLTFSTVVHMVIVTNQWPRNSAESEIIFHLFWHNVSFARMFGIIFLFHLFNIEVSPRHIFPIIESLTPALTECDFNHYPLNIFLWSTPSVMVYWNLSRQMISFALIRHGKKAHCQSVVSCRGVTLRWDISLCLEHRICLEKEHAAIKLMCLAPWQNSLLF